MPGDPSPLLVLQDAPRAPPAAPPVAAPQVARHATPDTEFQEGPAPSVLPINSLQAAPTPAQLALRDHSPPPAPQPAVHARLAAQHAQVVQAALPVTQGTVSPEAPALSAPLTSSQLAVPLPAPRAPQEPSRLQVRARAVPALRAAPHALRVLPVQPVIQDTASPEAPALSALPTSSQLAVPLPVLHALLAPSQLLAPLAALPARLAAQHAQVVQAALPVIQGTVSPEAPALSAPLTSSQLAVPLHVLPVRQALSRLQAHLVALPAQLAALHARLAHPATAVIVVMVFQVPLALSALPTSSQLAVPLHVLPVRQALSLPLVHLHALPAPPVAPLALGLPAAPLATQDMGWPVGPALSVLPTVSQMVEVRPAPAALQAHSPPLVLHHVVPAPPVVLPVPADLPAPAVTQATVSPEPPVLSALPTNSQLEVPLPVPRALQVLSRLLAPLAALPAPLAAPPALVLQAALLAIQGTVFLEVHAPSALLTSSQLAVQLPVPHAPQVPSLLRVPLRAQHAPAAARPALMLLPVLPATLASVFPADPAPSAQPTNSRLVAQLHALPVLQARSQRLGLRVAPHAPLVVLHAQVHQLAPPATRDMV